jgi:tetratricopeptide (TPR) repeat protein
MGTLNDMLAEIDADKTDEECIEVLNSYIENNPDDENVRVAVINILIDSLCFGFYKYTDLSEIRNQAAFTFLQEQLNSMKSPSYICLAFQDFINEKFDCVCDNIEKQFQEYDDKNKEITCDLLIYDLVIPFKQGIQGMWDKIANLLDKPNTQRGLVKLCRALEAFYYSSDNDEIVDKLSDVIIDNDEIYTAKELLGYTYYNMQLWKNAISYFEQLINVDVPYILIFDLSNICFWLAWAYGKSKNYSQEEFYYRKTLDLYSEDENALNNLGYCLYKQKRYSEAKSIFEQCINENRAVYYAHNNMVRVLLSMGDYSSLNDFIKNNEDRISKDLMKRAKKAAINKAKAKSALFFDDTLDGDIESEPERKIIVGVKRHQLSSEKILEDELINRIEKGYEVFGKSLKVYEKKGEYGRQFIIPVGRLDILAVDDDENLYAIELKKDAGYDDPYEQILRYIEWLQQHKVKKGKKVYGIICVNNPSQGLIDKTRNNSKIMLFEYAISYKQIT